jgi:hypothetical protein
MSETQNTRFRKINRLVASLFDDIRFGEPPGVALYVSQLEETGFYLDSDGYQISYEPLLCALFSSAIIQKHWSLRGIEELVRRIIGEIAKEKWIKKDQEKWIFDSEKYAEQLSKQLEMLFVEREYFIPIHGLRPLVTS